MYRMIVETALLAVFGGVAAIITRVALILLGLEDDEEKAAAE